MESQNLELLTCDHWPRSAEGLLGASCVLHHTPAQPAMGQGEDSASGDKWSYRRCVDSLSHRYLVTQISTQHYNLIFPFIYLVIQLCEVFVPPLSICGVAR